jgi:hypothetical protein
MADLSKMTKQDFFNLPTNKKTVETLYNVARKLFSENNPTHVFFNEAACSLNGYLYLPKSIKVITRKKTTESIYNMFIEIKDLGYRKELVMPF